jgi:hypothetical protein
MDPRKHCPTMNCICKRFFLICTLFQYYFIALLTTSLSFFVNDAKRVIFCCRWRVGTALFLVPTWGLAMIHHTTHTQNTTPPPSTTTMTYDDIQRTSSNPCNTWYRAGLTRQSFQNCLCCGRRNDPWTVLWFVAWFGTLTKAIMNAFLAFLYADTVQTVRRAVDYTRCCC